MQLEIASSGFVLGFDILYFDIWSNTLIFMWS